MQGEFRARFRPLQEALQRIPGTLPRRPEAVLVISGHWEEDTFTVMNGAHPPMLYDYYGFPEETYHVSYQAPGSPRLAERVRALLEEGGFDTGADPLRGFDHGCFVPMAVMYPDADTPVVQLSLRHGYDPEVHMRAGELLAPLRGEGVLIVGSGLSYHNLARLGPAAREESREFDGWLFETLTEHDSAGRRERLAKWETAPAARVAHPREDHLLPLMVATGAAGQDRAERIHFEDDFFGGVTVSSYRFG
jgi:aromatic ring-opening dioxygenase catalytic subunit (LigB family)